MRRSVAHAFRYCLVVMLALSLGVSLVAAQDGSGRRDRDKDEEAPAAQSAGGYTDADGDRIPDYLDNCPSVQNPNQPDSDGDGIGDHCDDTPNGEVPTPAGQIDVEGTAEAERTDQTTWDPGLVSVNDPTPTPGDTQQASADPQDDGAETIELASNNNGDTSGQQSTTGFVADAGVAGPPGYTAVFTPPNIPVDDGQGRLRPPVEPVQPEAEFEIVARIDAGVVAPRAANGTQPVGSVADGVDVAGFMRKDKNAPALVDLGLQKPERELLPDPTPTPELAAAAPIVAVAAPVAQAPVAADGGNSPVETLGEPPALDWDYDAYYAGGLARDRLEVPDIAGTDEPELYFTQRRGDARGKSGQFSYGIPVPAPGVYQVRLHFAEIYWGATGGPEGAAGKRVFSVDAEGTPRLVKYDIFADVGAETAVVKQFNVEVSDGVLDLRFYGQRDQPMVAAIEVLGAPVGERWVDVDMTNRVVRLMVGQTVVGQYFASFGEPGHATPPGSFVIQHKIAELTYTPYARNYFTHWAAFDQANELGFHSWTMDANGRLIGNADGPTWGCIATAPADAAAIFDFVQVGTRVEISP